MKNNLYFKLSIYLLVAITMLFAPTVLSAKNFIYQGKEYITDRPEGELKYFDVTLEITYIEGYYETSTSKFTRTVPFVFCDDGKVYARNLLGDIGDWVRPIWFEGYRDIGNICFNFNTIYGIDLFTIFYNCVNDENFQLNNPILYPFISGKFNFMEKTVNETDLPFFKFKKTGEGYLCEFEKDEGIKRSKYSIYSKIECEPSKNNYVWPPKGLPEEDYQVNFKSVAAFLLGGEASLRLKVIRTPEEIFIKGMSVISTGNPEAWIKGDIDTHTGKVVFKNALCFGVGRNAQSIYLTPMTFSWNGDRMYSFNATGKDLYFDYDKETGRLYNPSSFLGFTSSSNKSINANYGHDDILSLWNIPEFDFFADMEFIKIPEDIEFEPCEINGGISYLDKNGYMMEPEKLFIQYFDETGSPLEASYHSFNTGKEETSYSVPYFNSYIINLYGLNGLGIDLRNFQRLWNYRPSNCKKSILVYSETGEFPEDPSHAGIPITNIEKAEDNGERQIFDLTGRKYESLNLSPGIYIVNGKKVIIK